MEIKINTRYTLMLGILKQRRETRLFSFVRSICKSAAKIDMGAINQKTDVEYPASIAADSSPLEQSKRANTQSQWSTAQRYQ
jgi:hypothetical protein